MQGPESLGRLFLIIGVIIIIIGAILYFGGRFGVGRLPGDIIIERENYVFYFPLATGIIISIVLTLILNIFLRR